jgi:hypothetical protein
MSRGTQFCWCMGACSGIVVLPRLNTKKTNESTMTAHAMNMITPLHCFPTINLVLSKRVYWSELATEEKALFAFEPTRRIVATTRTRITANITAYSAIS